MPKRLTSGTYDLVIALTNARAAAPPAEPMSRTPYRDTKTLGGIAKAFTVAQQRNEARMKHTVFQLAFGELDRLMIVRANRTGGRHINPVAPLSFTTGHGGSLSCRVRLADGKGEVLQLRDVIAVRTPSDPKRWRNFVRAEPLDAIATLVRLRETPDTTDCADVRLADGWTFQELWAEK